MKPIRNPTFTTFNTKHHPSGCVVSVTFIWILALLDVQRAPGKLMAGHKLNAQIQPIQFFNGFTYFWAQTRICDVHVKRNLTTLPFQLKILKDLVLEFYLKIIR